MSDLLCFPASSAGVLRSSVVFLLDSMRRDLRLRRVGPADRPRHEAAIADLEALLRVFDAAGVPQLEDMAAMGPPLGSSVQ